MMAYVSEKLKGEIRTQARNRCEYCLLSETYSGKPHEFDHIVAVQHSGTTVSENLCMACIYCNRQKVPNLCSLDPLNGDLTRLFDPRQQQWIEHFQLQGASIIPLTAIGRATARVLNFNDQARLIERELLLNGGLYPEVSET